MAGCLYPTSLPGGAYVASDLSPASLLVLVSGKITPDFGEGASLGPVTLTTESGITWTDSTGRRDTSSARTWDGGEETWSGWSCVAVAGSSAGVAP